ncbi:MAG: 4-hydroxy-tetrahydrodipicolinate reductase [Clostridia bacterium]|nr:4-hydroxy-tetrahydrodipicolinate reductase [Clostridia bacterium]MDD4387044.1 4-hydroxy-tetrahydrodipicolinate reductase [Clostridia bacterium]
MKIGIVGGKGKLGSIVYTMIQSSDDKIEGIIIENNNELIDSIKNADVYIDCTTANVFMQNYDAYTKNGKPLVIATTGFSDMQLKHINQLSKVIPIIKSANFSIGAYKYLKIIQYAANVLGDEYRIGIIEKHHKYKKDRPSGTAKEMIKVITEVRPNKIIDVESIRLFDIVGEHELYFYGIGGETIELSHKIFNRESFASGAITAAKWILMKQNGLYSISDMLE